MDPQNQEIIEQIYKSYTNEFSQFYKKKQYYPAKQYILKALAVSEKIGAYLSLGLTNSKLAFENFQTYNESKNTYLKELELSGEPSEVLLKDIYNMLAYLGLAEIYLFQSNPDKVRFYAQKNLEFLSKNLVLNKKGLETIARLYICLTFNPDDPQYHAQKRKIKEISESGKFQRQAWDLNNTKNFIKEKYQLKYSLKTANLELIEKTLSGAL